MAARKRPAAALDAGNATTPQQSSACCKRSRTKIRRTAEYDGEICLVKGGFGCVLLARHRATRKIVAIKYLNLPDGSAVPPNAAEPLQFPTTYLILEAYDGNPYIVGFEGLVRDPDNGPFGLVMEYVAAPSLYNFPPLTLSSQFSLTPWPSYSYSDIAAAWQPMTLEAWTHLSRRQMLMMPRNLNQSLGGLPYHRFNVPLRFGIERFKQGATRYSGIYGSVQHL